MEVAAVKTLCLGLSPRILLQPNPFLNEHTSMFERSTETGSVWVTLKGSSLKSKVQRNKLKIAQQPIEYRCLNRATNGKKTISTSISSYKQEKGILFPNLSCNRACFPPQIRYKALKFHGRERRECLLPAHATSSDVEAVGISSQLEDFTVTTYSTQESRELKIRVEVSGTKTRAIFNDVFDKMVADAQPIPGFRRVKGGKTPNVPREILLEVLGASNVYQQVIRKVINSTVAEYVEKENLSVGTDLRIEQSIEDLEEIFLPDEMFCFDAVMQLQ